jgi:predicted Zn-dependent protease
MKSSLLLSAAMLLLLPALPVDPSQAQVEERKARTRGAQKAEEAKRAAATNAAPLYPQATREFPKQQSDKALQKDFDALVKLQEKDDAEDEIIAKAEAMLANPKANAFDKSAAAYAAGAAWQNKETDSHANSSKYFQLAIENNGLHNNIHYRAMLQLAQLLDADNKHDEVLKWVDRFLAETKSDDPNAAAIRTQILIASGNPAQAAGALEKALAAKPNDMSLMMNLAAVYNEADQPAKAAAMFDKMRAAGLLTEERDYYNAYHLIANVEGREKDALAYIDEGLKKGLLKPNYDIYAVQGKIYYDLEDMPKALEAWIKGAPLAKDGEMSLNVAQLQNDADHFAEGKAAALMAKEKGTKHPGKAWQALALAEHGLGNEAAARAAMQQAAKYPETQKWAESALRLGLGK